MTGYATAQTDMKDIMAEAGTESEPVEATPPSTKSRAGRHGMVEHK